MYDLHKLADTNYIDVSLELKNSGLEFSKLRQSSDICVLGSDSDSDMLNKITLGIKKCKANQKQHHKQVGVTKNFDIS